MVKSGLDNVRWVRDERNPILVPGAEGDFDAACCMNPWAIRRGDQYWLYYGGGARDGHRRICLATARVETPTQFSRRGIVLDVGKPGAFDAHWRVLPHVVEFSPGRWHLYFTGNRGHGKGLSAFPGIGLAFSDDGLNWEVFDENPILAPSGKVGDPDAIGIAGGSVLRAHLPDGRAEWRFYYTGCPTIGQTVFEDQNKTVCLAVSSDALHWEKRGAVMLRTPERDYENVGVAGPVVHQRRDGTFRMWYSAIGTRWGYYSICYAESKDGLVWYRGGQYRENLALAPQGYGWEQQMVEYPSVIEEGDRLRLFYCGNGYGRTGIGAALSAESASLT